MTFFSSMFLSTNIFPSIMIHTGEVDERLKLVVELAPDYISTRASHSGELLFRYVPERVTLQRSLLNVLF
jgi:hypothetical protein